MTEIQPKDAKPMGIVQKLCRLSLILAFLSVLAPLWWWAIKGMDADIGAAWFATTCLLLLPSIGYGINKGKF